MRKLYSLAVFLACALPAAARADGTDTDITADNRIKTLLYDDADVYTITTKYGYQTNIVFGPGEEVQTISVGDRSMWQIIPNGNRLFIRPMEEDVITNMTVLTNRHSYQFDLKSLPADKKDGNIYVARFTYPCTTAAPMPCMHTTAWSAPAHAAAMATMPATVTAVPAQPATPAHPSSPQPNYNYTYSGPDDLAPQEVYDDGHSTYLLYPHASQPLPSISIVHENGQEEPLIPYLKNGAVVVDVVAGKLAVKSPRGTVYVYNEMLNPS